MDKKIFASIVFGGSSGSLDALYEIFSVFAWYIQAADYCRLSPSSS